MRARFPLFVFALAAFFAGCDAFGSSDDVAGYWEGTSEFKVDTVVADFNARITADYTMTFGFDVVHDDGLVTGRITAMREGYLVFREAGFPADTFRFQSGLITNDNEAFGTYVNPVLEFDVPDGPYEEDMWTFDVVGSSAETTNFIRHLWSFDPENAPEGVFYDFGIRSKEAFRMRRKDRPEVEGEGEVPQTKAELQGSRVSAALRAMLPERLQRSEQ
ncbi:MAG: hypothetical protein AAFQ53_13315 [Bacteroidota bacterium]